MVEELSVEIVERVAETKGVAPGDLGFRLQDYIEVDAIEQLTAHDGTWTLSFELPGTTVTVTSDHEIRVEEHPETWKSGTQDRTG